MMTGWTITPGYPDSHTKDEIWEAIKLAVEKITAFQLIDEMFIGLTDELHDTNDTRMDLQSMAYAMTKDRGVDVSVTIHEDEQVVRLLASGGGKERRMKEHMRRAFIRCVLRRTAEYNVDINS